MSAPNDPQEVISLLRSADIATLYFYSQHMAEVIADMVEQVSFCQKLLDSLDSLSLEDLNKPLTKVSMNGMLDEETLNGLLEAMKLDRTNE
jgi:hypothetical protein